MRCARSRKTVHQDEIERRRSVPKEEETTRLRADVVRGWALVFGPCFGVYLLSMENLSSSTPRGTLTLPLLKRVGSG